MDNARKREPYPLLDAYLRKLPRGLASYPKCRSKAVLIRTAVETVDTSQLPPGLPPEIAALIDPQQFEAMTQSDSGVGSSAAPKNRSCEAAFRAPVASVIKRRA